MTQLQEMIYNVIPPNLLEKENITDLLNIFFKVVDDTCAISSDIPEYVCIDTDILSEDIMRIYLENIWSVLNEVKDSVIESGISGIQPENRVNYCYAGENFSLPLPPQNYFDNKDSVGLQNISINEELIVLEYTYNGFTEINKNFILIDDTNISTNTTIQQAINLGALVNKESCCATIPCAQSSIPLVPCTLGSDLNNFINNYSGTDIAVDILDQITEPYNITDCKSVNPENTIATEPKYKIGDNWLYVDFYVEGDYVKNNLSLNALLNVKDNINHEHIWSSKDFKQNKGHATAFYFAYNIIKEIDLDNGSTNLSNLEYMKLEEVKDGDDLVPFKYIVRSLIHKEVYERVIYPIAHPVGFNGEYKRTLGFNFQDNFCKNILDDYDVFFIYCINDDTYFDIRETFGQTIPSATGNQVLYNVEIASRTVFEQHNKSHITIEMTNGYSYVKDFDDQISLYDNTGIIIKKYNESCGFVPIKTRIKSTSEEIYLETIGNNRAVFDTVDTAVVPNVESNIVYRIDFSNDGLEEGGFLSDEHTKIYLGYKDPDPMVPIVPTVEYHIANGLIQTYNSDNSTKQNFGSQYKFLFNGMEYTEIQLCLDLRMDWLIHMKMLDNDCIPHHMIIQEPLPVPGGYSAALSPNLDLLMDQTYNNFDMNKFIQDYIADHGNSNFIAQHILDEQTDYLTPPGNINVLRDSLQGIDIDNDGVDDWTQFHTPVKDWGWIIGADEDNVLSPDYNVTNINDYIIDYIATNGSDDLIAFNINSWLYSSYYGQNKISPKLGYLETCGDTFPMEDYMKTNIASSFFDLYGIMSDEILFIVKQYLHDLMTISDSETEWIIKEQFTPEYLDITIPGPNTNTASVDAPVNVDFNAYISNYILLNGNSDGISQDILNQATAPGAVTDSNGYETVHSLAGLILDISESGGFFVGGSTNISGINIGDYIDGTVREENPPGIFTDTHWNSF